MKLTIEDISRFAGKTTAEQSGRELAEGGVSAGGAFAGLGQSEDFIWGNCEGSGNEPYRCSVDFSDPEKWVGRCTCPSRQKPCKHVIGLLFTRLKGDFPVTAVPEHIAQTRAKTQAKAAKPAVITKAKAASESKKCAAQLEGITLAEKVLRNITLTGFAQTAASAAHTAFEEQVKELGNYYIPGVQAGFTELLAACNDAEANEGFAPPMRKLTYLSALLDKGKTYLTHKQADYAAFPNMTDTARDEMLTTTIEEQLGYGWKLPELGALGRMQANAELVQAGFWVEADDARQQWIDTALWFSLNSGELYLTENFRPYKTKKAAEDAVFSVLTSSELYVYPGAPNPRARWEKQTWRDLTPQDCQRARDAGVSDYAAVIKAVKNQLTSPLNRKTPYYALNVTRLTLEDDAGFAVFDAQGAGITLRPGLFGERLKRLSREQVEGNTLVVRFELDGDAGQLTATPLALFTADAILRLV